jgi:SAM-dependent methyltransferase/methyltransferase-like protein
MQPTNPYDAIVYATRPRRETAPEHIGTLGLLLGLTPAPPGRCRVLEIGCSTGGNLFNLADIHSGSEFVGIDPSARQIDLGRQIVARLGLSNLRLECTGVEALDEGWGRFDYIIAHGVYSWIPAPAREALLAACRRLLAPQGIAYVSYNTLPGFHLRQPIGDLLRWHARGIDDPRDRVAQARAILSFVGTQLPGRDRAWTQVVHEELDLLASQPDFYIAHEHLEEDNAAFYFHQFIAAARRHGLQYLSEADCHINLEELPPDTRQAIESMSEDLVAVEQYVDFLSGRKFRRTLLVQAEAPLIRKVHPDVFQRIYLSGVAEPPAGGVTVGTPDPVEFKNPDGAVLEASDPVAKAAYLELHERCPLALSWDQLWEGITARLAATGLRPGPDSRSALAASLTSAYLSGLVYFQTEPSSFTLTPGERPMASRLARLQAAAGIPLTNRRHMRTEPNPFCMALLPLLDGTRDRAALAAELAARADAPGLTPDELRDRVERGLDVALGWLARSALLIG